MRGRREEATSFLRFISRLIFLMRLPRRLMLTLGFCLFVCFLFGCSALLFHVPFKMTLGKDEGYKANVQ